MEKVLAIYDSDYKYSTRFMEYFKKRRDLEFTIIAFTKMESLEEYLKLHSIEILLMEEGQELTEPVKNNVRYLYLLTPNQGKANIDGYPSVFKYRKALEVMSEVIANYTCNGNQLGNKKNSNGIKIVSLFSPVPDYSKRVFAWSCAVSLARIRKVLLISLELLPVQIISEFHHSGQELSEFIYDLKESKPGIGMKMRSLMKTYGNLSYLQGLIHGFDILSLTKDDILKWIEELKDLIDYDAVIICLEHYSEVTLEILRQSTVTFIPVLDKPFEKVIVEELEKQMDFLGQEMDRIKIQKVLLPSEEERESKEITLQELQFTTAWAQAVEVIGSI